MMCSCDGAKGIPTQVSTLMKAACSVLSICCLILKNVFLKCIAISKLKVEGMFYTYQFQMKLSIYSSCSTLHQTKKQTLDFLSASL